MGDPDCLLGCEDRGGDVAPGDPHDVAIKQPPVPAHFVDNLGSRDDIKCDFLLFFNFLNISQYLSLSLSPPLYLYLSLTV